MSEHAQTVAMIGAGGIAGTHLDAWLELGWRVRLFSLEGAPELARDRAGVVVVDSLGEALTGAGVVDVCTPTFVHAEAVEAAAAAGLHVLCEKPIALTSGETARLIGVCREADVQLYPGHVVRYFGAYAAAHAAVAAGELGRPAVQRFTRSGSRPTRDWFADPALSGGIVADQMIHDLDQARWNAGEVVEVFARVVATPDTPDSPDGPGTPGRRGVVSGQVLLTHADGTLSHVSGTWAAPGSRFRTSFEIAGTEALLSHDSLAHPELELDRPGPVEGTGLLPPTAGESPYLTEIRELAAAFTGGPPPRVSALDGWAAVRLAEAANQSVREGVPVRLDLAAELAEVAA